MGEPKGKDPSQVTFANKMLKILQLNLGRAIEAHDIAFEEAIRGNIDLMIVSEPNKKMSLNQGWPTDKKRDIAIVVLNKNLEIDEINKKNGYVYIKLYGVHIFATYISPNIALEEFKERIDEVFEAATSRPNNSIIVGDVNSKSPLWGSPTSDARGEYMENWLSQLTWMARNNGQHTFERNNSKSHIDVTLCPVQMARAIKNWQVDYVNPFTHPGHITYDIKTDGKKIKKTEPMKLYLNVRKYVQRLRNIKEYEGQDVYESIMKAYKQSTSEERVGVNRKPYWWNTELQTTRSEYVK